MIQNEPSNKRVTIQDIANYAGVGRGTVSRVLNDQPYVSDEAREKVMAAVAALDYRPNLTARQMRTQRSKLIGFLADEVATTPYASDIIRGAYDAAREQGYLVLVISAGDTFDSARDAVDTLMQRDVDAIVYAAMYHHGVYLPSILNSDSSIVVNSFDAEGRIESIVPDEEQAGYDATDHLAQQGHTRIGFINVNPLVPGIPASVGRHTGYRRALDKYSIPYDPALIREGFGDSEQGYTETQHLLALELPPTAIFCGNDRMAMGAYDAIKERGLRIPEDISIVGFDNQLSIADALRPSLTTMQLPHYDMGMAAVTYLIDRIEDEAATSIHSKLPCPLVKRNSTAGLPQ